MVNVAKITKQTFDKFAVDLDSALYRANRLDLKKIEMKLG